MQNTSVLQSAPTKTLSLKSLSRWAYPHPYLWATVITMFATNTIWIAVSSRISILPEWFSLNLGVLGVASVLLVMRNFRESSFDWFLHRFWCVFMCALFAALLLGNLMVLNHLLMTIVFPMADDRLLSWDRALGFNWLVYAKAMTSTKFVTTILDFAYLQLTYTGVGIVALGLVVLDLRKRTLELAFLLTAAAIFCLIVATGFPARAAMDILADDELLSRLNIGISNSQVGFYHITQLMELRGSAPVLLQPAELQGLATFPSFHTCLGVIIMRCSRGHWLTGSCGLAIGATIIASTPIYGGHYLVDLICAGVLMLSAIWFWQIKILPHVAAQIPGTPPAAFSMPDWRTRKNQS
jgi:PAP2 superfamily